MLADTAFKKGGLFFGCALLVQNRCSSLKALVHYNLLVSQKSASVRSKGYMV